MARKNWGRRGGIYVVPTYGGVCPDCGKKRWGSRKAAKDFAKQQYPYDKLSAYQCGDWWHIGHLTPQVIAGDLPRPPARKKVRKW